jgi:hypothetical protein
MTRYAGFLAIVLLCRSVAASAQEPTAGAGKLEVGFFPGGGMFFVGGDNNLEVNFNLYTAGGYVSRYLNRLVAIEGEGSFGLGLAQDIRYANGIVSYAQPPGARSFNANAVVFPIGSDRLIAGYVTGGGGLLTLVERDSTKQFGLTEPESFFAANVGGGLKVLRGGTGLSKWGMRIDYRLLSVGSKDDAAAFFAKSKRRVGHRIYAGFLYTLTR